jgi:hypothetical protein
MDVLNPAFCVIGERRLSDTIAKLIIYRAIIESDPEVPKHLARSVHDL